MKSIIQEERKCYLCGEIRNLHRHHCLYGTANRRLAEKDGLWIWLCVGCHMDLHEKGIMDKEIKTAAREAWCERYGTIDDFLERYGKIY